MNKEIDVNKVITQLRNKIGELEYEIILKNVYIDELVSDLEERDGAEKSLSDNQTIVENSKDE